MKMKKILSLIIAVVMIMGTMACVSAVDTVTSISTVDELNAFATSVASGNTYAGETVVLNSSLTLTGEWSPIGGATRSRKTVGNGYAFCGTFNGNGKTISGLSISGTSYGSDVCVGFFGALNGAIVKNLTLDIAINVPGNDCAGGLAGLVIGNTTIDNVTVNGSLNAAESSGGIVGRMLCEGHIKNSTNNATITGGGKIGGIAGGAYYQQTNTGMSIESCTNNGTVTSTAGYVGGIVGLSASEISDCTNTAAITGSSTGVGGIAGQCIGNGSIIGSTNTATIKNNTNSYGTGGIVGWVQYQNPDVYTEDIIEIKNNKNEGNIVGGNDGGGIIGTAYNAADVTGNINTATSISGSGFAAGIVANIQFATGNDFYEQPDVDKDNFVIANNISTTPIENITANCKTLYAWDNTQTYDLSTNSQTLPVPEWDGTTIASVSDLKAFRDAVNAGDTYKGKTVTLTADIDLNNEEWTPIATFSGTFDGGNKTIKNLKITHPGGQTVVNNVGLFGKTNGATIKDLTIENANITGSGSVAAVVGNAFTGTISNVTVKGNINIAAYQYVGGIVGWGYGTVVDCKVIGDGAATSVIKKVAASEIYGSGTNGYIGGINGWIGEGNSAITNCSVKDITLTTNDDTVGGICGIFHYGNSFTECSLENTVITAPDNDGWNGIIAGDIRTNDTTVNTYDVTVNNVTATADGIQLPALGNGGAAVINETTGTTLSGKVYSKLSKAVEAAVSGDVITMRADGDTPVKLPEGVTINSGEFEYTVAGDLNIGTKAELLAFAETVNSGNSYEGKTVVLTADIDMGWTGLPVGTKDNPFKGTFDGRNHVISNYTYHHVDETTGVEDDYVGLFGKMVGATIKNVKLHNPTIVGGAYVAGIVGQGYTGTIDNCHVTGEIGIEGNYMVGGITGQGYANITNCSVISDADWDYSYIGATYLESDLEGDKVGGIVGHCAEGANVINCTVKNVTIEGTRNVAGIAGNGFENSDFINCKVENVTIGTNATEDYANANKDSMCIGGIVGIFAKGDYSGGKVSNATVSNVTFTNENNVTVSAGAVTGGHRGASKTEAPYAPADIVTENVTVSNITGATNTYLEPVTVAWNTDTDAGYYMVDNTPTGMMRFLFLVDIDEANIVETGIKYIKTSNIEEEVDTATGVSGKKAAFFGDVTGIPEGTEGTYLAVAYVKTASGIYWSEAVECSPSFTKYFTEYTAQ